MLSSLYQLERQIDGRYATDAELGKIVPYLQSFALRLSAYRKLQQADVEIVQKVQTNVGQLDPTLAPDRSPELRQKCQRDLLFVLRSSAIALLFDDPKRLEETVLLWMQTIMRGFKEHQRHSDLTYRVLQEVVKDYLTPDEYNLFFPILELDRSFLGFN